MPASSLTRASAFPISVALAAGLAVAGLAACNQTAGAPPAPGVVSPGVTPSGAQLPTGPGCQPEIERFQALLKSDAEVGHLSQAVYTRASSDVRQAEIACAAGRDVQARTILVQAKRNYGYPL